jgi:DNA-binding CsgD family transcriptional regulator
LRRSDKPRIFKSVPITTRLGPSDYDAALELVSAAASTSASRPFEVPTIEQMRRMIPADRAGYFEYDGCGKLQGGADTFLVDEPGRCTPADWETDTVRAVVDSWPLQDIPCVPGVPYGAALRMSDFLTPAGRRRNPWYREVMRPSGIEHELKVWLSAPEGVYRGFFFVRGPEHQDFSERDRSLLELLRPHLGHIRARWEIQRRPPALTNREAEVVELVAQGLTNKEIASRLFVSPTTVRTHLENVFAKLDVHTRTAAVARARGTVEPR